MRFYGFHFKILQEVAGGCVQMLAMAQVHVGLSQILILASEKTTQIWI